MISQRRTALGLALAVFALLIGLKLSSISVLARRLEVKDINGDGRVQIMIYGDSNTFSWAVPAEELLLSQLQALIDEAHLGWTVVNAGWPGRSASDASHLHARLRQLGDDFIDLVIIALGSNDFRWDAKITADQVRDRLAALVSLVQHAEPSRAAVVATVPQFYEKGLPNPEIDKLNHLILTDHRRFPFVVDFHTIVRYPEDYADGGHFNRQGQRKRAEGLFRFLRHGSRRLTDRW